MGHAGNSLSSVSCTVMNLLSGNSSSSKTVFWIKPGEAAETDIWSQSWLVRCIKGTVLG